MATIGTTTHGTPFTYPPQSYLDRGGTSNYLYAVARTGATTVQLYRSTDGGTSWGTLGSALTDANLQEMSNVVVAADDHVYLAYRTSPSSTDQLRSKRFKLSTAVWGDEVLWTTQANGGTPGSVLTGISLTVAKVGSLTHQVIAVARQNAGVQGVAMHFGAFNAAGYVATTNWGGTREWYPFTGTGRQTPSVSIEHTGDNHTSATPHLWAAWGRTNLYLIKIPWNGSQWIGPTTPVTVATGFTAQDAVTGRWDGSRWLMAMPNPTSGATDTVRVYERNQANSATTIRTTPVHTQGVIRNCTVSYDAVTGNIRVFAVGTSTADLYYVDFIRGSGTWGSWTIVSTTDILGSSANNWGVRNGSAGDAKHSVYRAASGAPNTLTHDLFALAYAPGAPTWVNVTGQAANVSASLLLDWNFVDADPADTQSAYALSRQIGAGSLSYWRASDSTWQASEVKNTSTTSAATLASGWAAGADANYSFKVKVWDAGDLASVYGDPLVVVPSVLVNPTITDPTESEVWTSNQVTLTWTVSEQTAYRAILSITSGAQLEDSGWVAGTALEHVFAYALQDGVSYTITLQTRNLEGLASAVQTRNFSVDFLGPDTPTLVCTPVAASGYITVVVTNPAPTGGRPAVDSNDLYRRVASDGTEGVRVAVGLAEDGTHNDWRAASGVNFEYRVLAWGANGVTTWSAWTQ